VKDRPTDRHATPSVTIGRIYVCGTVMRTEELQKQAKRHIRRPTIKRDKKNTQLIRPTRTALNIHSVNGDSFFKILYNMLHVFTLFHKFNYVLSRNTD